MNYEAYALDLAMAGTQNDTVFTAQCIYVLCVCAWEKSTRNSHMDF